MFFGRRHHHQTVTISPELPTEATVNLERKLYIYRGSNQTTAEIFIYMGTVAGPFSPGFLCRLCNRF
jgi:hypothetical protein